MKYHFSFERKAIVLLTCAALLTGVLVFAEGILVGLDLHVGRIAPLIVQAPKLKSPLAAPTASGSKAAPAAAPAATATAAAAPASAAAAGAPPAASVAPDAAATQTAATCGTLVPTGAPVDAAVVITGPAPASAADGAEAFAIQMGAFLEAANASKLVADLKGRGCTAAVISQLLDPSHRMWNVVRIGPFPSLQAAARAAQDVQRSQGVLAIVRPADSM